MQGTNKGSDQTAQRAGVYEALLVAHTTLLEISCCGSYINPLSTGDSYISTWANSEDPDEVRNRFFHGTMGEHILTLCILVTPTLVLWQIVKTQMKCYIRVYTDN